MSLRYNTVNTKAPHKAFLYTLVFQSTFSMCLVVLLFASLLLQPLHQAYANEPTEDAAASVEPEVALSPTPEPAIEESIEPEELVDETQNDEILSEEIVESVPTSEVESPLLEEVLVETDDTDTSVTATTESSSTSASSLTTSGGTTTATTAASTTSSDAAATTSSDTTVTSTTSPSTGDTVSSSSTQPSGGAGVSTESGVDESVTVAEDSDTTDSSSTSNADAATETTTEGDEAIDVIVDPAAEEAVPTDPPKEVTKEIESFVTDANYYQFSKQACVSVGEGAYHCSISTAPAIDSQSVVFSEIGESGNYEIFVKTARGTIEQVTDNQYDDTAPDYDPETLQIVWQRLIDGRYQIILYDIVEEKETQLTFARQNSMEPAVSVTGVVWQTWDGHDWEIHHYDGTYNEQLTDNETQDVAPVLQDGYIIWTVIGKNNQYAQVYSAETKEIVTIENHEGGTIVNPRFVLVYDTQFDNGDVITQGFDPETGFSAPISATPAPEPIDIPDADSTGEIRALIQNKSSKEQLDVATDPDIGSSTPPLPVLTDGASSTSSLNLKAASSTPEVESVLASTTESVATTTDSFMELDEYDLIITAEEVADAFAAAAAAEVAASTSISSTPTTPVSSSTTIQLTE